MAEIEAKLSTVEASVVSLEESSTPPQSRDATPVEEEATNYLRGWPLHATTVALCLALFLPGLEATITATSLVAITNDLQEFDQSSWVITAYLLTYTGFLIICAKLSDIFGRKILLLASLCIFIVFSVACGLVQTMTQLIVLRAFQGAGASGTYSLVMVILFELVPPEKYPPYASLGAGVFALGLLLGPLLGGVINNNTTWRWVFYLNACSGCLAAILVFITLPTNFPHHGLPQSIYNPLTMSQRFSKKQILRVDWFGTFFLLSASILLVVVLEQTEIQYEWRSPFAIVVLIISALSWIGFLAWSRRITLLAGRCEPVFPWRFMQSRVCVGLLVTVFLTGAPLTVAIVQIPSRFQVVDGVSALEAGIRVLPFSVLVPIGASITASVAGKTKIPPIYLSFCGSALQVVGFALLSTLPLNTNDNKAQYGYQAIAGFAIGINLGCLTLMAPAVVEKRDKAVANSAILQFRTLGGAVGLAVVTTVLNGYVKNRLLEFLTPDQIEAGLKSTRSFDHLPPIIASALRDIFAEGYNLQMRVMIGTSVAQIPSAFLMWQKKQVVV